MTRAIKTTNYVGKKNIKPEEYILEIEKDLQKLYSKFNTLISFNKIRVGSSVNYAEVGTNGALSLNGTARYNTIVNLGIDALGVGAVKPDLVNYANTTGWSFKVNDAGYVTPFEIPYSWDPSTEMVFKIHWYCNNTSAGKLVSFQLDYNSTAENTENINATTTTITEGLADIPVPTTAYRLNEIEKTITASNFAVDDVISFQLKRIAATGGAGVVPDNPPVIISLELEYMSNKLGEDL